jgi:hypothetical protein
MRQETDFCIQHRVTLPGRKWALGWVTALAWLAASIGLPSGGTAQPMLGGQPGAAGMPNLRAISGKPLPDQGMSAGTVTVRLARQTLANPVANIEITALVEAPGGDTRKRTAKTDAGGRALFEGLPVGHQFHAEVVVDGEKLATDVFAVPAVGGVRTMLIAGLGAGADSSDDAPAAAAEDDDKPRPFTMGIVSGSANRDATLPVGTIEVSASDESGHPLNGKTIELGQVRAGGQVEVLRQVTAADGIARFVGVGGGKSVADIGAAIVMQHGVLRLGTDAFGIPTDGGVKVQLRVPERTADPAVITIGAGGRIILQLHDDSVGFIETLPLENTSDKIFDPGAGGVEIRLPSEAVNTEAAEGEHKIEIRKGLGVAVHGLIPPHRPHVDPNRKSPDEVTFGFVLPLKGSSRDFEQKFATGLGEFTFITDQLPGLTVDSTQITGRQDREVGAKKYWLMRGDPVPPGGTLRFTVRGLPAPDTTGRMVAGLLALALVAAAILFARGSGSGQKKGLGGERDSLVQRREKLFSELVAVETRHVGDRAGRGELVQKLESVYREIAALDERRAV